MIAPQNLTDIDPTLVQYVFGYATLVVCFYLAFLCFHKLRRSKITGKCEMYKFAYACVGGSAVIFAFAPLLGEWPGWTGFCFATSITMLIFSTRYNRNILPHHDERQ